jgi:hypothetical protein
VEPGLVDFVADSRGEYRPFPSSVAWAKPTVERMLAI